MLYTGFSAAAALAVNQAVRNHRPGRRWVDTLPAGHGLTLMALVVFAGAALGDLAWHEVLGIEVGLEALLSPVSTTRRS